MNSNYIAARSAFLLVLSLLLLSGAAFGKIKRKTEREFDVKAGGLLTLQSEIGDVEIISGKSENVKVDILLEAQTNNEERAEEIFEDFWVEFAEDGDEVIIDAEYDGKRNDWRFWEIKRNQLRVRFIIHTPESFDVSIETSGGDISVDKLDGDLKVRTSGGDVHLAEISGTAQVKTSGGDIELAGCSGFADVKTSGGDITIGSVRGETVAVTSGGDIVVNEVMGIIDARTSGGDIRARIVTQPNDDCRLTTSGGDVTVFMASDLAFDLDAKTSGGRVRTSFPVKVQGRVSKRAIKAEVNDGGPELYLRTSGGNINLREI